MTIELLGIKYITEKEASMKYGFSVSWFQKLRMKKESPKFIKLRGKGKILYPIKEIDEWFSKNIKYNDD